MVITRTVVLQMTVTKPYQSEVQVNNNEKVQQEKHQKEQERIIS